MTWHIDPTHSHLQFSVRHMMVATVKGKFNSFDATAEIDLADIGKAQVKATAEVASIDTGVEQRDTHLKSADFFDAENHPQMSLVTKSIKQSGEAVEVLVDLTIRGTTQPVTFKGEILGPSKDPWGNQRLGVSLAGEIEREAFGLTWNQVLETGGVAVGKKIKIEIDAEFIQK